MTTVINGLGALAVEIKTNHKSNIFSTSEARFSLQLSLSIRWRIWVVLYIHVDAIDRPGKISDESIVPNVWMELRERFKFQLIRKN